MEADRPRKSPGKRSAVAAIAAAPNGVIDHQARPDGAIEFGPEFRDELVRRAADALAEQRGFEPGRELDDWLEAEAVVDGQFARRSEP